MKNGKISRAMQHIDDELIMSAMELSAEEKERKTHPERRKSMTQRITQSNAWIQFAAMVAVFAVIFATVFFLRIVDTGNTVVAVDVNPSMEIELDRDDKVVEVRVMNDDAEAVIAALDLKGKKLDEAINAIIGVLVDQGFLSVDQNSILFSINTDDKASMAALKEVIGNEVAKLLQNEGIDLAVLVQSFKKDDDTNNKANENGISPAKATLIQKIIDAGLLDAKGVPYTYEVLAELNINDLKLILDSKSASIGGVDQNGTASTGKKYITGSEALEIALAKAGFTRDEVERIEVEMDFEDDRDVRQMVYEVDFVVGENEYEYELLASDGTVIEESIEPVGKGDHGDDDDDDAAITLPDGALTREKALEIALADAGFNADEVKRIEIEFDRDDGRTVYEIEFKKGFLKYEYTIDAATGEILEKETD